MKTKPFKKKPIYNVYLTNKFGMGCCPVKADNKKEARKKFKKRFPKSRIIDIDKATSKPFIQPI